MADTVTKIRFWTIADFREEEDWLRGMAREGLHFLRMVVPCFYIFEKGEPRDVIYRLDFTNNAEGGDYARMLGEFGWDRLDMVKKVIRTRMLPVLTIFLCCVLPQFVRALDGGELWGRGFFLGFFGTMTVLYVYLIIHCGGKLRRMQKELERE